MARVAAILLAAGESVRMGQLKALLPWQGSTLLKHQVSSLASAGVSRTIVVLGHQREELAPLLESRPDLEWVYNPDYLQGKTTSLKAGVRALGETQEAALLILNVDQPRAPQTIARIVAKHLDSEYLITIPCYQGKGGHPIALSTALIPELLEVGEETQGLKTLVRRHQADTQRVEMEIAEVLMDLNNPEEYRRALQLVDGRTAP